MILSLAALVSRLLGALYKPLIARIFAPFDGHRGAVGIGLTQVPLSAYQVILSFTSVGLNVGISKLVSERLALGDIAGAKRVFRSSLTLMTGLGLLAALGLWFGAPWLAALISPDLLETVPGFRAMAPAILITSIMAAYRGLFQGFQQMTPNALSQIIEQVVRVGSGALLTWLLVRVSVPTGAVGFNLGDVIGALAGLTYMLILARRAGRELWAAPHMEEAATQEDGELRAARVKPLPDGWRLVRRILGVAGPITIIGAVVPLMMMADTFFVFRALEEAGTRGPEAKALYGQLSNVFMIVNLPAVFSTALYTSILPAVSAAMALGQQEQARRKATQAYRLTFLLAVPAQAGLYAVAAGIYALLFDDLAGGAVMEAISWAAVPIMLQQTTSGVLQGIGKISIPLRNFLLGLLLKVGLTAYLTVEYGINGAAWATAAGFGLAALLNLISVERHLGRTFMTRSMLFKPVVAALGMVGGIRLLQPYLPATGWATILQIGAGAMVYGLAILLVRGVSRRDVEMLPKLGRPLAAILGRARLLR